MKTVLITGASRGLGLALVQTFYEHKYQVYAVVRTANAYDMLTAMYPGVSVLVADVTHENYEAQLSGFIEHTKIDIVINNAGSAGTPGIDTKHSTGDQLIYEFKTHCVGALSTVKALLNHENRMQPSLIVNISSRRGSLNMQAAGAAKGIKCSFSYRIAKVAQNMLSLCMADDLESMGIKVISVHPGALLTKMAPADATLTPEQSASRLVDMIERDDVNSRDFICLETGKLPW
ncbi:SDR family NAD(P)-dependent oxidoreductase [Aeromonas encheleia]